MNKGEKLVRHFKEKYPEDNYPFGWKDDAYNPFCWQEHMINYSIMTLSDEEFDKIVGEEKK